MGWMAEREGIYRYWYSPTHSSTHLNGVNVAWSSILVFKGWQMECTLDV